jgi:hypothetical protein
MALGSTELALMMNHGPWRTVEVHGAGARTPSHVASAVESRHHPRFESAIDHFILYIIIVVRPC